MGHIRAINERKDGLSRVDDLIHQSTLATALWSCHHHKTLYIKKAYASVHRF